MRNLLTLVYVLIIFHNWALGGLGPSQTHLLRAYIYAGDIYYNKGDYDSALFMYSIPLYLQTPSHPSDISIIINENADNLFLNEIQSEIYFKLGKVYYYLGEYNSSISILLKLSDNNSPSILPEFVGIQNYYLGMAYNKRHEYDESLLYYFKSLNFFKNNSNNSSYLTGLIYCDIGNVYYNQENYDKAVEYYNYSSRILNNQDSCDNSKISIIKNNIGSIHYRKGEYCSAIKYYKEAIKLQQTSSIDLFDYSMYLNNIAGIYLIINEIDSAEFYYNKSLQIRKDSLKNNNLLSQSYNQLGILYFISADYDKSLWSLQNGIICNTIEYDDTLYTENPGFQQIIDYEIYGISLFYKAIVLYNIYLLDTVINYNYLILSHNNFNLLFHYFEYIYARPLGQSNKEYFASFNREVINVAIDILYREKVMDNNSLFSISELGRSIFLYQFYVESSARQIADIPKDLIKKEKKLKNDIGECNRNLSVARNENIDFTNPEKFGSLVLARNKKTESLDSLIQIFEDKFPKYYQLKYNFNSVPLYQIQEALDENEAILEYHFSDTILYTMLISKGSLKIYHQKTDSIIESVRWHLKNIKFYDNMGLEKTGIYLYNKLMGSTTYSLEGIDKIIIIPDTELTSLPFETLIVPTSKDNIYGGYLISEFEICYHFSSSLWYKSRQLDLIKKNDISLFACAPGFEYNTCDNFSINRKLPALPYSKDEINTLENLFNKKGFPTLALYEQNATKQAFLENVSNYSIIHLATHNIYNKENPDFSGIAFNDNCNQNPDLYSNNKESSIVYVDETYNLLLNAELVILSACMTGFGKGLRGEGLITLYRGFFYSGAKNIIFTMWNAPDMYTSNFITTFYNFLFNGASYVSALRKTKLSFIRNEKTSLPIFWGNFLILGN